MPTGDAYSSGHLVLSHCGTCMCSNVEINLSWTCLVSGLLNFEHPSIFLFSFYRSVVAMVIKLRNFVKIMDVCYIFILMKQISRKKYTILFKYTYSATIFSLLLCFNIHTGISQSCIRKFDTKSVKFNSCSRKLKQYKHIFSIVLPWYFFN